MRFSMSTTPCLLLRPSDSWGLILTFHPCPTSCAGRVRFCRRFTWSYTEQPVEQGGRVSWEGRLDAGGKRAVHEPFDEDVLLGVRAGWLAGERGLQRLVALTGRLRTLPGTEDERMTYSLLFRATFSS